MRQSPAHDEADSERSEWISSTPLSASFWMATEDRRDSVERPAIERGMAYRV